MWSKRQVIDYSLQRREALAALRRPVRTVTRDDLCDADPILVRSAIHHGEPSPVPCPICRRDELVTLNYVFGAQLGQYSGRIKSTAELDDMQTEFGEYTVRVVEVCPKCRWNYMTSSYVLGDGVTRRPPRRRKTVEDIYG